MNKGYMVLHLDGIFQSWGNGGTEKLKMTSQFPTKSAIVGLISCALGYSREDKDKIADLSESLKMAVRMDRNGRKIKDFQNVGGGSYSAMQVGHCAVESLLKGGHKLASPNKLIDKEYLSDSAFTVVLEGDVELLEKCEQAIRNPKWTYTLGRYCCIPSVPIYGKKDEKVIYTEFESLIDAISSAPLCVRSDNKSKYFVEIEDVMGDIRVSDTFSQDTFVGSSTYEDRYVSRIFVNIK